MPLLTLLTSVGLPQERLVSIYTSREARAAGEAPLRNLTERVAVVEAAWPADGSVVVEVQHAAVQNDTTYNESKAMNFAYMAQLAYCPAADIHSWDCAGARRLQRTQRCTRCVIAPHMR